MLTTQQIAELRKQFPILYEKTYLYSCSQGALSDAVQAGIAAYASSWRNSSAPWEEWIAQYEELRTAFARFIHAKPEEVAIVTSASAGINPIANALSFDGRDRVVIGSPAAFGMFEPRLERDASMNSRIAGIAPAGEPSALET